MEGMKVTREGMTYWIDNAYVHPDVYHQICQQDNYEDYNSDSDVAKLTELLNSVDCVLIERCKPDRQFSMFICDPDDFSKTVEDLVPFFPVYRIRIKVTRECRFIEYERKIKKVLEPIMFRVGSFSVTEDFGDDLDYYAQRC